MPSSRRVSGLHSGGYRVGHALCSHAALGERRRWEGYWVLTPAPTRMSAACFNMLGGHFESNSAGVYAGSLDCFCRPPQLMQLGEPTGQEFVCSLAFSKTGTLLLAGYANGDVAFWEWHRTVWQNVKHVKGNPRL